MKIVNLILFLFFASLPLYLTEDFRLGIGGVTLTLNFMILIFLFYILILYRRKLTIEKNLVLFFIILIVLMSIHTLGFRSYLNEKIYILYIIKYLAVILGLFFSYQIAKKQIININKLKFYLLIYIIFSSLFLIILIFYYLSLRSPYLGSKFFNPELSRAGKNQLQIYLAITIPVIFYLLSQYKNLLIKILLLISMLVHIVSVIYVGSRGLWLTLGVTVLIYIAINFIKFLFSLKFKKTILINLFWIIFTGVILLNLTKTFETQHVIEKVKTLLYIFMHGTSNVDASVSERTFFLSFASEKIAQNPINMIIGFGLGAFQMLNPYKKVTHNDYIFFLFDLGILGLFIYLFFILLLFLNFKKKNIPIYLILPFFFDLIFINAYNFLLFWIIIGLFLGINDKEMELNHG